MLELIDWDQFLRWEAYDAVEPFGPERLDQNVAHLCKVLWDIARDTTVHPEPFPLSRFLLHFGDDVEAVAPPPPPTAPQPVAFQERLLTGWTHVHNLRCAQEGSTP